MFTTSSICEEHPRNAPEHSEHLTPTWRCSSLMLAADRRHRIPPTSEIDSGRPHIHAPLPPRPTYAPLVCRSDSAISAEGYTCASSQGAKSLGTILRWRTVDVLIRGSRPCCRHHGAKPQSSTLHATAPLLRPTADSAPRGEHSSRGAPQEWHTSAVASL